jgi:hypothetical protein
MPNLSIEKAPPRISLSGNDVVFKVKTDNQYSKVGTKHDCLDNFAPYSEAGSSFVLNWGNVFLTFVAAAEPDDSGLQYRSIPNGMATEHWVKDYLVDDIKKNYYVNRDFVVQYHSGTKIRITARKEGYFYQIPWMAIYTQTGNDAVIRPNHRIHLEVITPEGEPIGEDSLPTELDGSVSFNIAEYLRKATRKQFSYPENSQELIIARPELTTAFKVRIYESFGTPPVPQRVQTDDSVYYVLHGGISWLKQALINRNDVDWYSRLVNNRTFLSNQPVEKITDHYTTEKLYMMPCWLADANKQFKLVVKRYFNDGNTSEDTLKTIAYGDDIGMGEDQTTRTVHEICVSAFTLHNNRVANGVPDYFTNVAKYEVWVINQANDRVTEIRSFIFDTQYHEFVRRFLYRNSKTALESLRCTGKQSGDDQYEMKSGVGVSDLAYTDLDREQIDLSISENRSFKINTGYLPGKAWENTFRDFAMSKERYIEGDSFLIPIRVTSNKMKQSPEDENLYALEFEYQYAFTDEHYSQISAVSKFDKSFTDDFQLNKPSIL